MALWVHGLYTDSFASYICWQGDFFQEYVEMELLHADKKYIYYMNQRIIDIASCVDWSA